MSTRGELLRFSLVTPLVGLTDFGVYFACLQIMPIPAAKAVSFVCGAVVGYLLNKYVTFRQHKRSYPEIVRYLLVQVFLLAFNVGANQLLLALMPEKIFPSMLTASILTAVVSFILKKWWVFKHQG